jgi:tetratricopeptide (TPR) repeat protein
MAQYATKVLLVGWDSADWQIIDPLIQAGQLPQLDRLVQEGAAGRLRSLPPFLSPMIWTSIATGKRPHVHGIHGFTEVNPVTQRAQPVSTCSRRSPALWTMLSASGIPSHVISWFVSYPAEVVRGVYVSEALNRPPPAPGADWPIPEAAVYPLDRAQEFAALRVRPEEINTGILDLLVPRWREVDQARDPSLRQLMLRLAELYTAHNCAAAIARTEPAGFIAVYYHFLDWISHDFMRFHPPQQPGVDDDLFDLYCGVVAASYRLQDLLLTDLLNQSGPGTTVVLVSDHGFQSGHLRPLRNPQIPAGIAAWHRPYGIVAMGGPGVQHAKTIPAASVLDITPTLLTLLGLPMGCDMHGRPLHAALDVPEPPKAISSWDQHPGLGQFPLPDPALVADNTGFLLQQFADLGYIRLSCLDGAARSSERENSWNLGVSLMDAGDFSQALPHLEDAFFHQPEDAHIAFQLAQCQVRLGLIAESHETAECLLDAGPDHPLANFLLGQLEMARGHYENALAYFDWARSLQVGVSELEVQAGRAYLHLERWAEARQHFKIALEHNPDDAVAWLGLARANFRDQHYLEALEQAQQACDLDDSLALAHLTKAQVCSRLGQTEAALQAFTHTFERRPGLPQAQQGLLDLLPNSREGLQKQLEVMSERLASVPSHLPSDLPLVRSEVQLRQSERVRARQSWRQQQSPAKYRSPPKPPGSSGQVYFLVSGLPRSGTSLMMQMLQRGGMPLHIDQQRAADDDNPEGYFEWAPIKNLPTQPQLIEQSLGKAVKVVSLLLSHLPAEHRYQVVFMRRPVEEVARSQRKMIEHQGGSPPSEIMLATRLREHERHLLTFLNHSPQFQVLTVDYPDLVSQPQSLVPRLRSFFGEDRLPLPEAMIQAIKPQLYRNRQPPSITT